MKTFILHVDAFQTGLWAALLQDSKVIAYASISLTAAEKSYINTGREMLGVVVGCHQFHQYLDDRKVICKSYHQASTKIHLKHFSDAPSSLQRLPIKIQLYGVNIQFIPGPKVPLADTLMRANPRGKTLIKGLDVTIHQITPQPQIHIKVQEIKQAAKIDQILQILM